MQKSKKTDNTFPDWKCFSFFAWLFFSYLPNGLSLAAGNIDYMAGIHQSAWEYTGTKYKCELSHTIPDYGTARFIQKSGEDLVFWINVYHPTHKKGKASLLEVPPSWLYQAPDRHEIHIHVTPEDPPILLNHSDASWLLNTLERGRMGSFNYRDWEEDRYQVRIRLNPVNFHPSFNEFQRCRQELFEYGFNEVRYTEVKFKTDKFKLNEDIRSKLHRVANYTAENPEVIKILIRGHTDDVASDKYNITLSSNRAQSVADFFSRNGIEKDRIQMSHFGETLPKVRNITVKARAINRRVEVELIKNP
ncbi:MAG: OmpA family protein [Gammaproteobacteria bacterium]|nr:OmpA family protein [Gammaproteobacteria bacterium]